MIGEIFHTRGMQPSKCVVTFQDNGHQLLVQQKQDVESCTNETGVSKKRSHGNSTAVSIMYGAANERSRRGYIYVG